MVRKADKKDLNAIFELVRKFATSFKPQKDAFIVSFRKILQDEQASVFVKERNGDIVGYCMGFIHDTFYANGKVAWIEEIMVREEFRRSGIGSELIKAFEQESNNKGCKLVALATRRAEDFYCANGYEKSAVYFRKMI